MFNLLFLQLLVNSCKHHCFILLLLILMVAFDRMCENASCALVWSLVEHK